MDWKSHLIFGALLGAAAGYFALHAAAYPLAIFAIVSAAAALLPDLDERTSKASKVAAAVALAAIFTGALLISLASGKGIVEFATYALLLLAAAFAADRLVRPRHRGIMHSLVFAALAFAASYAAFGQFFALAIACGYFSHLLADRCVKII
jgi:membrane-bound metal-dependent hydrolase YbcI (DUF457 family)